jgi:hypothetical protein
VTRSASLVVLAALVGTLIPRSGDARERQGPEEDATWTCDGRIAMLRRSEIVEGGSVEGGLEATRDHLAWYRSHGAETNPHPVARVVERDTATGAERPSENEVVTFHIDPPDREELPVGDEAWEAFVAKYTANSRIVDARRICLPDF